MKIRRQITAFRHPVRGANQKVFALAIEACQCADHIADVRSDAEFRHPTDVDGYFHEGNLTIEEVKDTENSLSKEAFPERSAGMCDFYRANLRISERSD
jgi:hypothetical protein